MNVKLDFSALDTLHEREPGTDGRQQRHEPTQKATVTAEIKAAKVEIVNDIFSGKQPYSILLKAIKTLATLTNDLAFYEACRDTVQARARQNELPQEWQKDELINDIEHLEAARRNIEAAIEAHRQQLG